jgi:hypothetical protein
VLKKKVAGFPVQTWLLLIGGGAALGLYLRSRNAKKAAPAPAGTDAAGLEAAPIAGPASQGNNALGTPGLVTSDKPTTNLAWENLAINLLIGLTFLTGFGIAFYHAGVEWKVFPGPASCASGKLDLGAGQKLSDLINKPIHVPSCGDAAWRFPAADWGISMAGLNAIISLALVILTFIAARRPGPGAARNDTANETSSGEAGYEPKPAERRTA